MLKIKIVLFALILFFLSCEKDPPLFIEEAEVEEEIVEEEVVEEEEEMVELEEVDPTQLNLNRIDGVGFVSPSFNFPDSLMAAIPDQTNAGWIALNPIGRSNSNESESVQFDDNSGLWWGSTKEGIATIAGYARDYGLKIMIKPNVEIQNGDVKEYQPIDEGGWLNWEADYADFILQYAELADSLNAEIFCIGNSYSIAVQERPQFWANLIQDVRAIYSGDITYAADWQNVENVSFWEDLDYIGVNAFYPVSYHQTPEVNYMRLSWQNHLSELESLHQNHTKPILFTEYGYRSCDQPAWNMALLDEYADNGTLVPNMQAQRNAYDAFYQSVWVQDWVAGGFIHNWEYDYNGYGGLDDTGFTPQRKPVEELIELWYE